MGATEQMLEITRFDPAAQVERLDASTEIPPPRFTVPGVVVVRATGDGQLIVSVVATSQLADREHCRTLA